MIHYAIEIETELSTDVAALAMTNGYIRLITDRPDYDLSGTIPVGDNSVLKVTIDNAESLNTAIQSGILYTSSYKTFKAANTLISVRERFVVNDSTDTSDAKLDDAKGSAPAEGDMFEIVSNTAGSPSIKYVGKDIWYQDLLTRDGMTNPSRRVDLLGTGDYGTLSGFSFKIDSSFVAGTGTPFWKLVENNDIQFSNKIIRLYAVLDDDFYQIWTGVVDNTPQEEQDFVVRCVSNFKKVHKDLPPKAFDTIRFPDADPDVKDESVPVCLGDIVYASIRNITGDPDWRTMFTYIDSLTGKSVDTIAAQASAYVVNGTAATITLEADNAEAVGDGWLGHYLFVVSGEGVTNDEEGIRIISSTVSAGTIILGLAAAVDGFAAVFDQYKYDGSGTNKQKWNFSVSKMSRTGIVSNKEIESFKTNNNKAIAYVYNQDKAQYETVDYAVIGGLVTNSNWYDSATADIISTRILKNGAISILYPVPFSIIDLQLSARGSLYPYIEPGNDNSYLTDLDRSTFHQFNATSSGGLVTRGCNFYLDIEPEDIDFDKVYFGADLSLGGNSTGDHNLKIEVIFRDQYQRPVETVTFQHPEIADPIVNYASWPDDKFNILPNDYYTSALSGNGLWTDLNSRFQTDDGEPIGYIKDAVEIPSDIIEKIKDGSISQRIQVTILVKSNAATAGVSNVKVKQFGFLGIKSFDITNGGAFTRLSGEALESASIESNTVYGALRVMLENSSYDNISPNDIDYRNLLEYRSGENWMVGRQLTEKKNSKEYIRELCESSFVAAYQNRKGKIAFSAWQDLEETPHTHDNTTIQKGGIEKWDLTDLDKIFNSFFIRYGVSPGNDKFLAQHQITNVDDPAGNPGGLLSQLWDVARDCYVLYDVVKSYIFDLPWFTDRNLWYNSSDLGKIGIGTEGAAYNWLQRAVFWLTRQKRDTVVRLPLNTTSVVQEMTDKVQFRDPVYTDSLVDSTYLTGNIYFIEHDIQTDEIIFGDILQPADTIDDDHGNIIETGSAADTITESGSASDTITEDGV